MTDPTNLSPGFAGLVEILARLRAPDGCPWDREQTHESLLKYLLEESVEVVEASRSGDTAHLAEELGDVLLQVVFHAQIAAEAGTFTIDDVVRAISEKMIRRHPHVFGASVAETSDAVLAQWEVIKAQEKAAAGKAQAKSVLDKVSRSLPALARAQALQNRAAKTGFVWPEEGSAWSKVKEGLGELKAEEYGDLLFALVSWGRRMGLEAEEELIHSNAKFEARFREREADLGVKRSG
jgi:MazG family protein